MPVLRLGSQLEQEAYYPHRLRPWAMDYSRGLRRSHLWEAMQEIYHPLKTVFCRMAGF